MNHYHFGWFTIRSGLSNTCHIYIYIKSHIYILGALKDSTLSSYVGNDLVQLLAQYNQNFFSSIFMASLSQKLRNYKFTHLWIELHYRRKKGNLLSYEYSH